MLKHDRKSQSVPLISKQEMSRSQLVLHNRAHSSARHQRIRTRPSQTRNNLIPATLLYRAGIAFEPRALFVTACPSAFADTTYCLILYWNSALTCSRSRTCSASVAALRAASTQWTMNISCLWRQDWRIWSSSKRNSSPSKKKVVVVIVEVLTIIVVIILIIEGSLEV